MTNGEKIEIEIDDIYRDLTPDEAVGVAISEVHDAVVDVKKTAIKEITKAREESTFLSYLSLLIGAMFGVLGSLFVSTTLRWYDAKWCFESESFTLFLIGLFLLVLSLIIIFIRLRTLIKK